MPCAWNCDYTPNALDGRSIKAGEERRVLESRPNGDTQFNLNAYYLFWVSHTSCLVKQGGNFFSPRGLKKQIYCIIGGEYKVNSSGIKPAAWNSFFISGLYWLLGHHLQYGTTIRLMTSQFCISLSPGNLRHLHHEQKHLSRKHFWGDTCVIASTAMLWIISCKTAKWIATNEKVH